MVHGTAARLTGTELNCHSLDTYSGSAKYTGSSMRPVRLRMSACREKRSVIVARSLCGARRCSRFAIMCVVYVVRTSFSQAPVVNPLALCGAYADGCGRPSIQITIGTTSSQPPTTHATVEPVRSSVSFHIGNGANPNGKYVEV